MFSAPLQLSHCSIPSTLSPHLIRPNSRLHGRPSPQLLSRIPASLFHQKYTAPRLCSKNDPSEGTHIGNVQEESSDPIDSERSNGGQPRKGFSSKELMQKLKRYGVAGVLSYGLLNTVYYLTTFLLVWFYFAPASGGMGYAAAVQRFLKLMAIVWAGSQVTKIVRAGGALALAPFVDRGLSWFAAKFRFESEGKAFTAIVCMCLGVALLVFFGLTLLWA